MEEYREIIEAMIKLKKDTKYSMRYIDYDENQWTIPCNLTQERFNRIANDKSIIDLIIYWDTGNFVIFNKK